MAHCELPDKPFRRAIGFVLKRPGSDVREVMVLRPFALRANGHIGFLCKFALRVPDESELSERFRLELSLTHKNGKTNEDFYLDHREKIELFLRIFYDRIRIVHLHDSSDVNLERRLSVISSFVLDRRVYPACDLASSPVHPELPRRGGATGRARPGGFL